MNGRDLEDFRRQCVRQLARPVSARIRYGFFRNPNPVRDSSKNLSFSSMSEYRRFCEESYPEYFGYARPGRAACRSAKADRLLGRDGKDLQAGTGPSHCRRVREAWRRVPVHRKRGAIVLGYPGATQDVGLFPRKSRDNGRRIVAALTEIGFALSDADRAGIVDGMDFVQISSGPFDVDLVFAPDGIESYDAAVRNAVRVENFSVMSIADIIASKRAAGRKRDLAELDLLEEFRKAYEASKPGNPG